MKKCSPALTTFSLVALLAVTGAGAAPAVETGSASPAASAVSSGSALASVVVSYYPSSPSGQWTIKANTTVRTGPLALSDLSGAPLSVPEGTTFAPNSSFPSWVQLNSLTGELTFSPPADVTPGQYPLSIYVARPGSTAVSATIYVLVAEKTTDTENIGLAGLYSPVQVPSLEVARPGETYTADLGLYHELTGAYLAGSSLTSLEDFSHLALPEDAAQWVSVQGGSVSFALPANVPAGVTTIWQTIQVVYSDGNSEYFNLFIPVETGSDVLNPPVEPSPSPSMISTPAPSESPSSSPVSPAEPSVPQPSAEPTEVLVPTATPSPEAPSPSASSSALATSPSADAAGGSSSSPSSEASPAQGGLASTGARITVLAISAAALLVAGLAFMGLARRKTR